MFRILRRHSAFRFPPSSRIPRSAFRRRLAFRFPHSPVFLASALSRSRTQTPHLQLLIGASEPRLNSDSSSGTHAGTWLRPSLVPTCLAGYSAIASPRFRYSAILCPHQPLLHPQPVMSASWAPAPSFRRIPRYASYPPSPTHQSFTHSPTPGGVFQSAPRWYSPTSRSNTQTCVFCSSPRHYVRQCPEAAQYLRQGKIIYNSAGRLSLPNGCYPPGFTPGKNLRERIDNYRNLCQEDYYRDPYREDDYPHSGHDQNPSHDLTSAHYLEIVDESSSDDDSRSSPTLCADSLRQVQLMEDLIDLLSEKIQRLKQSKQVESPTRPGFPFRTRNDLPTGFPQSQIHDDVTRSPTPWIPLTPPKSATFRQPNDDRFNDHLTYTPQQPLRPMIPIAFRYPLPTIADPDSPETSRTTADYHNIPPTIADYRGSSRKTADHLENSRNIAESCYRPAIKTSIKNAPENSNLDAGNAISTREYLPVFPNVPSEVSDNAPSGSELSPRTEEDPFDSWLSAFPDSDEAEEIIDFYLSFESGPPSDCDNEEYSDSPASASQISCNRVSAHLNTPDQLEERPSPHHSSLIPISRPSSSLSSTSYYSSFSRSPLPSTSHIDHRDMITPTTAYSALSNTSLDEPYEFSDLLDVYADSPTQNDLMSSRNETSPSPDFDRFRHHPRHSPSPIPQRSAMFSIAPRFRL